MPGKKKEGTAGGVSGGGSFLDEKGCLVLWCLVKKIEGLGEGLWCLEKEGEEAVGSVSREWSLFLERKEDREERCLGGS